MPTDTEDQMTMFKELDMDKPEHKALHRAAKNLAKLKGERQNLLTTSKAKVDSAKERLIAAFHECKFKKFKSPGVKAELIETSEDVEVTIEDEDEKAVDDSDD